MRAGRRPPIVGPRGVSDFEETLRKRSVPGGGWVDRRLSDDEASAVATALDAHDVDAAPEAHAGVGSDA